MDIEKLKKEITDIGIELNKKKVDFEKLRIKNIKGFKSIKDKIKFKNKYYEIVAINLEYQKKVDLFVRNNKPKIPPIKHTNQINKVLKRPLQSLLLLFMLIGLMFSTDYTNDFQLHQAEFAISDVFGNISGGYLRDDIVGKCGYSIEPVENTTLLDVQFTYSGCNVTEITTVGVQDTMDLNIWWTPEFTPAITPNDNYGLGETCVMTCAIAIKDSDYNYYQKSDTISVGYSITGCEQTADCTFTNTELRGYYYYDDFIQSSGTITIAQNTNRNYESYVYLIAKGQIDLTTLIENGADGVTTGSCDINQEDGQHAPSIYFTAPYIELNTLTMNGGNGASCNAYPEEGGRGGAAGRIYFNSNYYVIFNNDITLNGGNGGLSGVRSGGGGYDGGSGQNGGRITLSPVNHFKHNSGTIIMNGGNGAIGANADPTDECEDGGDGGNGGDNGYIQNSAIVAIFDGGNIEANSGNGADGGDADCDGSCGNDHDDGGAGGHAGDIMTSLLQSNKNITFSSSYICNGGDGADSGVADCCGTGSSQGNDGGDGGGLVFGLGRVLASHFVSDTTLDINGGDGGNLDGGCGPSASDGFDGDVGGCTSSTEATNLANFYGPVSIGASISCNRGAAGVMNRYDANWSLSYNAAEVLAGNNFGNLNPVYTVINTSFDVREKIELNFSIIATNLIKRINLTNLSTTIPTNLTFSDLDFFYIKSGETRPYLEYENNSTLHRFRSGEYTYKGLGCSSYYCTDIEESNLFNITNITVTLTGTTDLTNTTNITTFDFNVYCNYTNNRDNRYIYWANVDVYINDSSADTTFDDTDFVYEYENTVVKPYSVDIPINCSAFKQDFDIKNVNIANFSFNQFLTETPYGNPMTVCLFPNQTSVEPLRQNPIKYIIRLINLDNVSHNFNVSFNYPLPASIVQGMKANNFTWDWSDYTLLSTTPQLVISNLNGYDGSQNISNYSTGLWLLTNCTNANPGVDILNYTGDYVFIGD